MRQNRKLLESTIVLVELRLQSHTSSIRLNVVLHIPAEPWPIKLAVNQSHSLSLTKIARQDVVIFLL